MHVTIAPASTRTAAAVIRSLLAEAPDTVDIHALYRNLARVPKEFADKPNFHALQGDVSDPTTLDFTGSDAVLAITPPTFEGGDIVKQAEILSKNIKDAIEAAGSVKRLVLLSSVGAQLREGVGEIKTNNAAERVLATTNVPSITFVRCAYFMENWTMGMDTLKAPEPFFFSTITPLDWKVPMVAVADIGSTLAAELLKEEPAPSKPHIYELHGPRRYTPLDVQAAFSKAVGKQVAVKPVEKSELHGFYSQVFPPEIVGEWVEMSTSFLEGGVMAADKVDYRHVNNVIYNRFAESARVNWITSYAATAEPAQRQQWDELMTPRSIGLILRSIKTDYKLPITYPDQVTVIHKLSVKPDYGADSVILEAVILSEQHKRIAARCFEDIAVYDYQAAKRAPLKDFMVDELRKVYDLQEKNKAEMDKLAAAIDEAVGA
ncbi:nucleoside-diphosphate-sugar epimerase [Purpureocillium lilacinum]|uniref:Nucleoside-diphosphate-sugar epimerase n=1 Tax=Purpureocillium lilacinum TaxID=33203 RepID=A0A179GCE3_PURLI|nr:nucleoside-diphosphate-sugar epimerase [Purpureocillium lilacinum]